MKVRLTRSTLIEGSHHAKGEVLELPDEVAKDLVGWLSAEYVAENDAAENKTEDRQ
ncbi:MAG TPA: hypothetical protein VKS20_10990 [Candidatus Acidoferrales bacterium]|nr:hypothetical protein [Candidatus Acidoferrales bacterium]